MTNSLHAPPPVTATEEAELRTSILADIQTRWDRLSDDDVAAMRNSHDLLVKVVAKYGQDRFHAQSDIDIMLKGRPF
jgi:hypothetical protein